MISAILTESLTFLPLALGISISYNILRATDMTLDASFVLGGGVFAKLVTLGFSPYVALVFAMCAGICAGIMVSFIQRGGKIDPLLAGVLATFILASGNLIIMGRPNINILTSHTLFSDAFGKSDLIGWVLVGFYCLSISCLMILLIRSSFGLKLRALGDNPNLFQRLGSNIELYRTLGFSLTNCLAAISGCITAQTIGYADIGMGLGMTLTGIGTMILGQYLLRLIFNIHYFRIYTETLACLIGILFYFALVNTLLKFDINTLYLKLMLGILLVIFLRTAIQIRRGNS